MQILDPNFTKNKTQYVLQAVFCAIAVAIALVFFDVVDQPMIVASFGASAFIAFTRPQRDTSSARYLIGGYVIGIVVGCTLHFVTFLNIENHLTLNGLHIIAAAFAVGLAMFFMSITNTEHAPGTSIALGFTINDWTFKTIGLVMVGIILISVVHKATKRWMVDVL